MVPRRRSVVRLAVVLLLLGGLTTQCAWMRGVPQRPRRYWWQFWRPKPVKPGLDFSSPLEAPAPPPPAVGPGALGPDSTIPIEPVPRLPGDVATPETQRPPRIKPAGMIQQLQNVYFDFDRYDLKPEARKTLDANAEFLLASSEIRILIEGHCDERGTLEYNMNLGQRRADAVREYLISKGVAPERMSTISYGEERPMEAGHDEAAWSKNRRAQFQVYQP